jgi:hypothetical protein
MTETESSASGKANYSVRVAAHSLFAQYQPVSDILAAVLTARGEMPRAISTTAPATQYGPIASGDIDSHIARMLANDCYEREGRRRFRFQLQKTAFDIEIDADDIRIDPDFTKLAGDIGNAPIPIVWLCRSKAEDFKKYLEDALGVASERIARERTSAKAQSERERKAELKAAFDDSIDPFSYSPRFVSGLPTGFSTQPQAKRILEGRLRKELMDAGGNTFLHNTVRYQTSDFKIDAPSERGGTAKLWVKGIAVRKLTEELRGDPDKVPLQGAPRRERGDRGE